MNDLPLHPKLVHLPMALAVLMPLVSGGVLFAILRSAVRPRAWILAIACQALLFVTALFAQRSGSADEERVERAVPESAIEEHEEAAEVFVLGAGLVLGLSLLPLFLRSRGPRLLAQGLSIAGTVVVLGLGWKVGEAGGALVYRHGAAQAFVDAARPGAPAAGTRSDHGDDDDDR